MQGIKLCELAQLVGLTQSDIAKYLGITRVQVHRWAHGVRPLPERFRTELTAFVMRAVRCRVEELIHAKRPALAALSSNPDSSPQAQLLEQLVLLAGECLYADREAAGEGPTAVVPTLLNALDPFRTMSPEEMRKPANAEKLRQLTTSLGEYAALLCRISPMFDFLPQETAMPTTVENLLSLEMLAQQTPAINVRMLKHWLHLNLDGFRDRCAVKIGRRVLLDSHAVTSWVEAHRPTGAAQDGEKAETAV